MDVKEAGRRGGKAKNAKLTPEQRKASTAKARAAVSPEQMEETLKKARAARWPEKRHTFDCKVENCRVTIHHEHV
jgi:hypothetical protein